MHTHTQAVRTHGPGVPASACPGLSHIKEPICISGLVFDLREWAWINNDKRPIRSSASVTFDENGEILAGTKILLFTPNNVEVPPTLYCGPFPCNQAYFATGIEFAFQDDPFFEVTDACTWLFRIEESTSGRREATNGTGILFGPVATYLQGNDRTTADMPLVFPPSHPATVEVTVKKTVYGTPGATVGVKARVTGYMMSRSI